MSRIVRSTLAEQAYLDLRERIMAGRLPAGRRLMAEELAATLAISPTPVKEALLRLATDGLVEAETRRGVMVRRITGTDVAELYEARLLVECHALRHGFATGAVGPALVRKLRAIQTRLVARRALGTEEGLTAALELDRAFHAALVALAANRVMAEWHARLLMQTHTLRVYSVDSYRLGRLQAEHEAIVVALRGGDREAAGAALERHLTLSRDELLARLADGAAGGPQR
jgi:DNA-binding GntR family transcriptional regulator